MTTRQEVSILNALIKLNEKVEKYTDKDINLANYNLIKQEQERLNALLGDLIPCEE